MPITRNRLVCISRDVARRRDRPHAAGAQYARRHAGPLLNAGTERKVRTTMSDFVLRGGTLVFPDRAPEKKDVLVKDGKIDSLLAPGAAGAGRCREQVGEGAARLPRPHRLPCALRHGREDHRVLDRDRQRRAGRLHHRARLLPQQRGVRRRLPPRAAARGRARARRLRLPLQHRQRAAYQGARRVRDATTASRRSSTS